MELPFVCSCGHLNMIDMEKLEKRPLGKIYSQKGYRCGKCGAWKTVLITSASMDDAMRKLNNIKPARRDFPFHFGKTLKRVREIQSRGAKENGSF